MLPRRPLRLAAVATAAVAVAAVIVVAWRRRGPAGAEELGPSGVVDHDERSRTGSPADRGRRTAYGLNVERLRTREGLEPVVEYLTYIQSQRDDESHLLFVRYEDIDAMAALDGAPVTDFLERLDQLGVVVSTN